MAPDNREGGDITAADMVLPDQEPSAIQRFFKDSTVFITGASGYLGKLIVEKLLRTCPDVRRIYVLLREKKGKDGQRRFQELFEVPIFDPLKRSGVDFAAKVSLLSGDCSQPDLGLSDADKRLFLAEVEVIFHCAATVRFDEHLRTAAHINVRAVRDLVEMGRQMRQLRAFVHVSTAFAHCPRREIAEVFYEPKIDGDRLLALVDALDDETLTQITPTLLGDWPNTYVFTKSIAEQVVEKRGKGLPIAVVRPSIVIGTVKEPVAGWIDNFYGSTGILIGAALGVMRSLHGDERNRADVVPADYVINTAIAAAWNVATLKVLNHNKEVEASSSDAHEEAEIPIYNYVNGPENPITWKEYIAYATKHALEVPSPHCVWYNFFKMRPNRTWHNICVFLLHFLPAYVIDGVATLIGRKPIMVEGYKKIDKFGDVISYFAMREWNFKNNNTQALWRKMKPSDRELFEFNIATLDWDIYNYTYIRGARLYLLKDPLETVSQGKAKYRKLRMAHYALLAFLALAVLVFVRFLLRLFL